MNSQVDVLHSKAMAIADDAFIARRRGNNEQAKQLSSEAFIYERDAALLLREQFEIEPTRSVLFRSAGWLAFNAEKYEQAQEMIDYGLQGQPPFEVKAELDELLHEIDEIKAVELKTSEYQTDITNIHFNDGENVSSGKIKLDFFAPIINSYNEFRKAISHNFCVSEQEFVATESGSFSIFLKPTDREQIQLDEHEQQFSLEKKFSDVLNYSTKVDGLKKLNLTKNELKRLKQFLNCIRKKEASINFNFNSFNNKKINYSIDKNRAISILESINKLDYDEESEVIFKGCFIAIDLKSKNFKFLIENNESIGGRINDIIYSKIKEVFFSGTYKITALKHETKNAGEQDIHTKYSLINIE